EAALDGVPSIVIDPKGDMGNLCFTDPNFSTASFEPWVADEADSKNEEINVYARDIAKLWKEGIESWDQGSDRIAKFHAVEKTIYTPGSSSGVEINVMHSLESPSSEVMEQGDALASYLKSTVTGLLSFIGLEADPLESKEYILLAQIISKSWINQERLTIEQLIGQIINPAFDHIGVLQLEDFYPQEQRFNLATKFNALLASPNFSQWLKGEELDIQKLLYDENGKAKIAIFSISHLNDNERMFFVTLLLNRYVSWMRRQSGTSALKTILYMDEIFGFFPPTKNPPSKAPMLLLLKQARAFGVGVVLSTQNPVDIDYKGLSNIGTWFIGRLQTTQDIDRVIEGLSGKVGADFSKNEIRTILSNLAKRTFFLKSAHLDQTRLFTTRWVLSYLKGPLKYREISQLMQEKKLKQSSEKSTAASREPTDQHFEPYQKMDDSIPQYFEPDITEKNHFIPYLCAKAKVHFYQERSAIDEEYAYLFELPLDPKQRDIDWETSHEIEEDFSLYAHTAPKNAEFGAVPQIILGDKGLTRIRSALADRLYRTRKLELFRCRRAKLESKVEESRTDFMIRLQDRLNDSKEEEIEKLQERYSKKEKMLLTRLARAKERVEKESSDSQSSLIETGIAILGALMGKRTPAKIGTAVRKGSRVLKERGDIGRAQERVREAENALELLEHELEDKIDLLDEKYDIDHYEIEDFSIKPRKSDIDIGECAIVWRVF
ncbi:MAG: ATP-binding protein, partial [Sulfurovum sp.]